MRGISWLAANQLAAQEGLCTMEWVKRPRRDVDHPLPYSAEDKERVKLYIYSHSGLRDLFYSVNFNFPYLQYTAVIFLLT